MTDKTITDADLFHTIRSPSTTEAEKRLARALAEVRTEVERLRGGQTCPACPVEVRDLAATAHNFLAAWDANDLCGVRGKVASLRASLERFVPILDRHFAGHQPTAARAVPVWEDAEAVERAARAAFIGWGGQGVDANEASAAAIHDRSTDGSEHREAWRRAARAALRAALGGDHA